MKDGTVQYWSLLPNLLDNLVIQAILTGLVGALIAWLTVHLNREKAKLWAAPKGRSRTTSKG
jgi:hypothetical protein